MGPEQGTVSDRDERTRDFCLGGCPFRRHERHLGGGGGRGHGHPLRTQISAGNVILPNRMV